MRRRVKVNPSSLFYQPGGVPFIKFPLPTGSLHHPRVLAAREGEVDSEARLRGEGLGLVLLLLRIPQCALRDSISFISFFRPAPSEGRAAGSLNAI